MSDINLRSFYADIASAADTSSTSINVSHASRIISQFFIHVASAAAHRDQVMYTVARCIRVNEFREEVYDQLENTVNNDTINVNRDEIDRVISTMLVVFKYARPEFADALIDKAIEAARNK